MPTSSNQELAIILGQDLQEQLIGSEHVLLQTIMDLSDKAMPGIKSISLPKASGQHTGGTIPTGGSVLGNRTLTIAGDVLSIDQKKEVSDYIPWVNDLQSQVSMKDAFFEGAPKSMVMLFEAQIVAMLAAVSANDFNSGTLNSFTIDDLRSAKKLLDKAKISKQDRFVAVNAEGMAILNGFTEFTAAGVGELANTPLREGFLGRVMGFTVVQSEDVADADVHCYHRNSVAFALQAGVKVEDVYDAATSETFVALKAVYGAMANQSGIGKLTITMAV